MDELFTTLHAESDRYEKQILDALEPGRPLHWRTNIRSAWLSKVRILLARYVNEHAGRGKKKRAALYARIGRDPRCVRLVTRMEAAGVLERI